MRSRTLAAWALVASLVDGCGASQSQPSAVPTVAGSPAGRFTAFVRAYFDRRFQFDPSEATSTGVHTHDDVLDDVSPAAVQRYGTWLARERDALDAMIPSLPEAIAGARAPDSDHPRLDAQILRDAIALEYTRLVTWNEYATHPSAFHQMAADTIYQLMVREFAPVDVRIRAATARLVAIPAMLAAGEATLSHPPHLAVEVALREIAGSIEMVGHIFPTFADRATDPAVRAAARQAAVVAAAALERHRQFLEQRLLPTADGDYHDGRERWTLRARLADGVTETPEALRDDALAEVHRLQADIRTIAQRIGQPGEDPMAVLARMRHQHPTAAGLLDAYRARQGEVRGFVRAHDLVTIDASRDALELTETPAFIRATIFAALSAPGPLEQVDRRTLFYVTPADVTRPAAEIEEYLTEHSNPSIVVTTIHEAYPGHHVQGIHQRSANSFVRQLLWQGTYGEGWAHYCEQMVVDAGYGDDVTRLDQRQEALLRAARAYLDVSIHVFGMSYEDAVRFYREQAFMSEPGAVMEARRVALGPASVFVYTYGKFALYRLRAAVGAGTPGHMSVREFHDALLDFGSAPVAALARARFGIELAAWTAGETPAAAN